MGKDTKCFTYFVSTLPTTLLEKSYNTYFRAKVSQAQKDEKFAQGHKTNKWWERDLNPGSLISQYMLLYTPVYVRFVMTQKGDVFGMYSV